MIEEQRRGPGRPPKEPEAKGEPASWKGPQGPRLQPCSREIKMLRPLCQTCEDAVGGPKFLPRGWWETCEHDPYVSLIERPYTVPIYEDELDSEGKPTGIKIVVRQETKVRTEARPNWTSVTAAGGMNKGKGVERALRRGFIYPQQLRSPLWPNGIKRRCQFRECFAEDVKKYRNGWFCREMEAKLVAISDNEETYQVAFGGRSEKLQKQQIDSMVV